MSSFFPKVYTSRGTGFKKLHLVSLISTWTWFTWQDSWLWGAYAVMRPDFERALEVGVCFVCGRYMCHWGPEGRWWWATIKGAPSDPASCYLYHLLILSSWKWAGPSEPLLINQTQWGLSLVTLAMKRLSSPLGCLPLRAHVQGSHLPCCGPHACKGIALCSHSQQGPETKV